MANRAEVNRLQGIDSRLIGPDEIKRAGARDARLARTRPIRSWARSTTRPAGSSATTPSSGASRAAPTRRRRDPPVHRGHRPRAHATGASTRCGPTAARSAPGRCVNCTAGWSTLICDMAGVRAADHHPHPAGVRDRAGQAAARRGDRLLADARLHLADRPRRVPDGRRDRAVDDLPDAGHAELPAGGHAATRSSCSRSSSRRACCAPGPGCATSAPTTARSSARPRSTTSTSAPAGAPTASRPRRSSARRSPSWSTPAARPT